MKMASCLVPDFPAVVAALERLKELDKQLREERVPFAPEVSLHLTEITAAVTGLEADRRATREKLEVETIENSKLRHQINNTRERMSEEIMADVAAARASNAEEMEQLHKDLKAASQLHEETLTRQQALMSQNKALCPEREKVKAEHEAIIATLNDEISLKYDLQVHLDHTQEQIDELNSCRAAVEQDRITLQQNMTLEREAFSVEKDNLSRELEHTEEKIKQQKQAIGRRRRELESVNHEKEESNRRLDELTVHMDKLESNMQRLTETRCQCEKQLEGEAQQHQELRQQRETLKKELRESGEAFSRAVKHLQQETTTVEDQIEAAQTTRLLHQDALAQSCRIFKCQQDEENEVRAEYFHVSQQLERSKLQLQERIVSIVKQSMEIKEMDKQIRELLEADTVNRRVFERSQEELCGNLDTEKKNVTHFEEEKRRLSHLLEEAKRKQEEHVAKMTADIINSRKRYEELRQEEAALQKRQPESADADLLLSHVTHCEVAYRQIESAQHQQLQQCIAEAESVMESNEKKQREVEENEEILKELEAKWNEEQGRHRTLTALTSELEGRRTELELSIQGLKEKTSSMLQSKEEMKAKLEEMRDSYTDMLGKQASELRAVEVSIYNNSVNLEQVNMENSRLHLCITQMTEDICSTRQDRDRYLQEIQQLRHDSKALRENLEAALREDLLLTQECQSSDGVLLASMFSLLNQLATRRQQLGNVSALLHQQMLEFSKRLGDKAT